MKDGNAHLYSGLPPISMRIPKVDRNGDFIMTAKLLGSFKMGLVIIFGIGVSKRETQYWRWNRVIRFSLIIIIDVDWNSSNLSLRQFSIKLIWSSESLWTDSSLERRPPLLGCSLIISFNTHLDNYVAWNLIWGIYFEILPKCPLAANYITALTLCTMNNLHLDQITVTLVA